MATERISLCVKTSILPPPPTGPTESLNPLSYDVIIMAESDPTIRLSTRQQ